MHSHLIDFEKDLDNLRSDELLERVAFHISRLCAVPAPEGATPDHIFDHAVEKVSGSREAALFLVRALSIPNFIQLAEDNSLQIQRKSVKIFETHLPDLCKHLNLSDIKQNSEKFLRITSVFLETIDGLSRISKIGSTISALTTDISGSFRLLSNSNAKVVLSIYDFVEISSAIKEILNGAKSLTEADTGRFSEVYRDLSAIVHQYASTYSTRPDPLCDQVFKPFLVASSKSIRDLGEDSTEKFACKIRMRQRSGASSPAIVERRFPLHDPQRVVRVKLPLANDGPGSAVDVRVEIACADERIIVDPPTQELGTVKPGNFPLYIDLAIGEPLDHVDLLVDLSWRTPISTQKETHAFECRIHAQDSTVDWDYLEQIEPYSTAVAEGNSFVGRAQKLRSITSRLQKRPMQSSLITGQKRVGKTSLALAVSDRLMQDKNFYTIYLEYGDYAQLDAKSTIEYLCDRLFSEFESIGVNASESLRNSPRTSLAVVNQMAQALSKVRPDLRVVVILDEFDEIHPEMYRFGAIAETFFSNLRTLSAKTNVAFVLVGGENMPFIVAAQGDQLNKFVSEEVDYFSRSEEWEDYQRLIAKEGVPLRWHSAAIERVFSYTNGHPYYTNLLCAEVLRTAVVARDTDITEDEIEVAVSQLAAKLSTNVFAHFWKDGVPGERDHAEVVALKRCKFLVAAARVLRKSGDITVESISSASLDLLLDVVDITPLINDFLRRGIISENGSGRYFAVPLFEEWLKANGIRLIADTLGSELEAAIKTAEETAYVTSAEIVELTGRWPLYKGRRIDSEMVRHWLEQAGPNSSQRILFKILSAVDFVSEEQVREMMRQLHSQVKFVTSVFSQPTRTQRRYDLLVTYIDGPGKSGAAYASKYAEENLISSQCVIERVNFSASAADAEKKAVINGIVIVDDVAGTGNSLSANLKTFFAENAAYLNARSIPVVIAVMYATTEAEERIRDTLKEVAYPAVDFIVCRHLSEKHRVLDRSDIWADEPEKNQARQIVESVGRQIYKDNPLGYGGMALNLVFFDTCPNNSLPILHSAGKNWKPLFPRIAN